MNYETLLNKIWRKSTPSVEYDILLMAASSLMGGPIYTVKDILDIDISAEDLIKKIDDNSIKLIDSGRSDVTDMYKDPTTLKSHDDLKVLLR